MVGFSQLLIIYLHLSKTLILKKKKIRINPKLTDNSLQNNIVKARKIIVELYVNCETDYVEGLKIYEAIVEKKIIETTQKQINTLQKESDKIITETQNNIKPAVAQPNVEPVVQPNVEQPIVELNNNINQQNPQSI